MTKTRGGRVAIEQSGDPVVSTAGLAPIGIIGLTFLAHLTRAPDDLLVVEVIRQASQSSCGYADRRTQIGRGLTLSDAGSMFLSAFD